LWPSALPEPLAAAGLFGAVLILDRLSPNGRQRSQAWFVATVAGIVFFAGLLSKEIVLAALPALGCFLVASRKVRVRYLIPASVAGIVFLIMRSAALDGMQAAGADATQRIQALKVYPILLVDGLRSMLTMQPIGIRHLSWEYAGVSWSTSVLAAALCAMILVATIIARRIVPLAPTAALTTGLMLFPIALVATVPGWGGFGRYLYVPLAVTSLAMADLGLAAHAKLATRRPSFRWAVPAIVAAVIISEIVGLQRALHVYANQENLARAAIEIFPDGPDAWEWLGNVYLDRGEMDAARECYREATKRAPELFRPRHNLAAALLYTGRPAEALEQLEILDSLHPPTGPGSKVAVDALMELGRWDEAGERLVLSLDRDPDYGPLVETASRLLEQHPRQTEFRAWLEYELVLPEHRKAATVLRPMLGG
jgi:tetratricopeptide (TPR) repeat protein